MPLLSTLGGTGDDSAKSRLPRGRNASVTNWQGLDECAGRILPVAGAGGLVKTETSDRVGGAPWSSTLLESHAAHAPSRGRATERVMLRHPARIIARRREGGYRCGGQPGTCTPGRAWRTVPTRERGGILFRRPRQQAAREGEGLSLPCGVSAEPAVSRAEWDLPEGKQGARERVYRANTVLRTGASARKLSAHAGSDLWCSRSAIDAPFEVALG
jgi:hypothetical protein